MNLSYHKITFVSKNHGNGSITGENPMFYTLQMMKLANLRNVLMRLMMMVPALLALMSLRNRLLDWVLPQLVKKC